MKHTLVIYVVAVCLIISSMLHSVWPIMVSPIAFLTYPAWSIGALFKTNEKHGRRN